MLDLNQLDEAVRSEGGVSRRLLLAYAAALAAIPTLGLQADEGPKKHKVKFASYPFDLGVASGDPTSDGFVIWTRLAPKHLHEDGGMPHEQVDVRWAVAADEGMKKMRQKGTVTARPKMGHSVHVEVSGLNPDTWYWYQFHCGGEDSPVGRTRTMPAVGSMPDKLRFAFASCQNYEDGHFTAYEHMADDDLDLVIHLGDYIYEFHGREGLVRKHVGSKCESLADYRVRYSQYKHTPPLRAIHARCPWLVTWDDHEVEGNYANAISKNKDKGVSRAEFLKMRAHAYQAYYEMMPLRTTSMPEGPDLQLYRSLSFGQLASFKMLDTRQYRTNQPNGDDASALNAAALNPNNTLLGAKQAEWLKSSLLQSNATWNVLAQQVMMGMVDRESGPEKRYSMDAWPGYAVERMKLIKYLAEHRVANPIVLTGDIHSSWVNELRVDDREHDMPIVATEFVGTSISSGGDGHEVKKEKLDSLFAENPFVKYHNHQRGYVRCTVTPKTWQSDYRIVEVVTTQDAPVVAGGSFVVEAGNPAAKKA